MCKIWNKMKNHSGCVYSLTLVLSRKWGSLLEIGIYIVFIGNFCELYKILPTDWKWELFKNQICRFEEKMTRFHNVAILNNIFFGKFINRK